MVCGSVLVDNPRALARCTNHTITYLVQQHAVTLCAGGELT